MILSGDCPVKLTLHQHAEAYGPGYGSCPARRSLIGQILIQRGEKVMVGVGVRERGVTTMHDAYVTEISSCWDNDRLAVKS